MVMNTLQAWQSMPKENEKTRMIVQASSQNGHDDWQTFPIGMSWQFVQLYRHAEYPWRGPHDRLVLCALSTDTDRRRRGSQGRELFVRHLSKNCIENRPLSAQDYFESLPHYQFVISPEGNGIDCHRHYEALIAGCIPIMEENKEVEQKYEGCPILWTQDYHEITTDYLIKKYEEMKGNVYDFQRLFLEFYSPSQQEEIRECGNYWVRKILGDPWYR